MTVGAALSLCVLPGCATHTGGTVRDTAAARYVRGDLLAALDKDHAAVSDATRVAIKGLEFAIISDRAGAAGTVIVARTAVDKKVEISLTDAGKNLTDIKIRVGVFGDEQLSRAVLDKIRAAL